MEPYQGAGHWGLVGGRYNRITGTTYSVVKSLIPAGRDGEFEMAKIEFYGPGNTYHYGQLKDGGRIDIYDSQGNYWHGKLKDGGRIDLYDHQNRYYHGKLKADGKIELYDEKNAYYYGKVKN
ncbi:hypothetical protein [Stenotrophomonas sp. Sm3119]|uniref:hypothetical protein n=1 Tax=Stenotrophomonas sp. Sm3119 TaxID=3002744 RepID=UPI0027E452DE|nr:hypothetical protein [Stenotrophomonas sp. Sm3119]